MGDERVTRPQRLDAYSVAAPLDGAPGLILCTKSIPVPAGSTRANVASVGSAAAALDVENALLGVAAGHHIACRLSALERLAALRFVIASVISSSTRPAILGHPKLRARSLPATPI